MKILSIVGARPQFIKAAPLSRCLRAHFTEILLHTGQHYDYGMSEVFFRELEIPDPDYNLEVGSGSHGAQTGHMLMGIEEVLLSEKPDLVLVYGDTNSTLAGALSAVKLHIKLAHVEAGLRSFKKRMPEEINRVLTDHCSDLLFCPTAGAVENLANENIRKGVYCVGDVMYDALLFNSKIAETASGILDTLTVAPGNYLLATVHRAENTDGQANMKAIIEALCESEKSVILPLHPRTARYIDESGMKEMLSRAVKIIPPVSYLDMLRLEKNAAAIITDSGGVQKEAFLFGVPCITLRDETEWVETVELGANVLTGAHKDRILEAIRGLERRNAGSSLPFGKGENPYGDGHAAECIVEILRAYTGGSRETGVGRWESGDGSREMGVGRWESGDGSRETGVGRRESGDGSREMGVGRRESGDGSREMGVGRRESGDGSRETPVY